MPTATAAPPAATPAKATWRALGVDVTVLVTDPDALVAAERLLAEELLALDLACSRFRPDSEIMSLLDGGPVRVSPLLAEAVAVALEAARSTDGDVDPTLGGSLCDLGYDRDFAAIRPEGARLTMHRLASWRDVRATGDTVEVPAGVLLDLGATAKALGADRAAARLSRELGCGVLVNLGGDLAVAGPAPEGGWAVRVQDKPHDTAGPQQTVALHHGALATSSTTARRWHRGGEPLHHLLDPRSGLPVRSRWRTASVVAPTCVQANTASTAAIIRGDAAVGHLQRLGHPARLVDQSGQVITLGGWPC